jgi:hypothetical protein
MVGLDIGKNSWSPDGQRSAVISREGNLDDAQTNPHQYTLRLPTVRGSGATAATATFTLGTLTEPPTVIGWSGDHHVIIGEPSAAGAMDIRAIDVHDGHIEPVSRVTDARATAVELPASTLSQLAPSLSSNDAS